jgi:hypothetical protein
VTSDGWCGRFFLRARDGGRKSGIMRYNWREKVEARIESAQREKTRREGEGE